jgi:hypothetical protein
VGGIFHALGMGYIRTVQPCSAGQQFGFYGRNLFCKNQHTFCYRSKETGNQVIFFIGFRFNPRFETSGDFLWLVFQEYSYRNENLATKDQTENEPGSITINESSGCLLSSISGKGLPGIPTVCHKSYIYDMGTRLLR